MGEETVGPRGGVEDKWCGGYMGARRGSKRKEVFFVASERKRICG